MARLALVLFLVFVALFVLRSLRAFLDPYWRGRRGGVRPPRTIEGEEMVRDPVCGTWIDRRLALAAKSPEGWVPVCSEKCREELQRTGT